MFRLTIGRKERERKRSATKCQRFQTRIYCAELVKWAWRNHCKTAQTSNRHEPMKIDNSLKCIIDCCSTRPQQLRNSPAVVKCIVHAHIVTLFNDPTSAISARSFDPLRLLSAGCKRHWKRCSNEVIKDYFSARQKRIKYDSHKWKSAESVSQVDNSRNNAKFFFNCEKLFRTLW